MFTKGYIPWHKGKKTGLVPKSAFKKGMTPWNKGLREVKSKKCQLCKKIFTKPYRFNISRWKKVKFCSLQCTGKAHRGEFAPAWKGGKTLEQRFARLTNEYKEFRKRIIERDNRKCTNCSSGLRLEIHHIKSFSKNPELRFVPENTVTLCRKCHELTDNYKGRENKKNG